MNSNTCIPKGWRQTTLGELGEYLNGRAFKTSEWSRTGRPIIRIQDLTGSNRNPNYFEGTLADRYVVCPGDFLISWSATLGAFIWDGPEGVLNQHIFKVESNINKRFHYHLVRERIVELERNAHGSGMVHVTKGIFESTPVVVPECEIDQENIASLIDKTETLKTSTAQHLATAHLAIERFRQAILTAASAGRLTADWREEHHSGSGQELIESIEDQRRAALGKRWKETSLINEHLWETPSEWVWVTPEQLIRSDRLITYGVIKLGEAIDDGVPTLRSSDVRWLRINGAHVKQISKKIADNYRRTYLDGGEVVVTVRGTLGGVAVVPENMRGWNISREVAVIPLVSAVHAPYVAYIIGSSQCQRWLANVAKGVAYTGVNIGDLRKLPLPLPPIEEQMEIARRVEQMMKLADSQILQIDSASIRVDRTTQAVLAKAFRGELVPESKGKQSRHDE